MDAAIAFTLNGKPQSVTTDPERPLLEVLREDLHLTGAKYGCGEGECRACTVLLDREPVPSCITPIVDVRGKNVQTIEGLARGDRLHPVQEAFLAESAYQCGYCTAGMILGIVGVMQRNPHATEGEYREELQKHICRCGGYPKYAAIVSHIARAGNTAKARS